MEPLRKFLALSPGERRLLLSSALGLVALRLSLWVLPLRTHLRLLPSAVPERERAGARPQLPPEKIGWAVRVAGRYVPGARNCLVQALATRRLLARHGHAARLCLGVAKTDGGGVKGHAWVDCEGKIVMGGGGVSGYAKVAAFPAPLVFPQREKQLEIGERGVP